MIPALPLNDGTMIPQVGFGTLNVQPDRHRTSRRPPRSLVKPSRSATGISTRLRCTAPSRASARRSRHLASSERSCTSRASSATAITAATTCGGPSTRRSRTSASTTSTFLIHWPLPTLYHGDSVSTWRALTELVADGRLRSAGVASFQPEHLDRIITETGVVPVANQIEVHPYFKNDATRAASRRHDIAVEAFAPLGHFRVCSTTRASAASRRRTAERRHRSLSAGTSNRATSSSRSQCAESECKRTSPSSTSNSRTTTSQRSMGSTTARAAGSVATPTRTTGSPRAVRGHWPQAGILRVV